MKQSDLEAILAPHGLHFERAESSLANWTWLYARLGHPAYGIPVTFAYSKSPKHASVKCYEGVEALEIVHLPDPPRWRTRMDALRGLVTMAVSCQWWQTIHANAAACAPRVMLVPSENCRDAAIQCAHEVSAVLERYGLRALEALPVGKVE